MTWRCGLVLSLIIGFSSPAFAGFSETFKTTMAETQAKVLLESQPFSADDARRIWGFYDEEIAAALKVSRDPIVLNQSMGSIPLKIVEKHGKEIEEIELGHIGVQFYKVDEAGKLWIVTLLNELNGAPVGTFRIFREIGGKFVKVAALDDATGPWNRDDILAAQVQIQIMSSPPPAPPPSVLKFASFHSVKPKGKKPNRLGIIWELRKGDVLKATQFVPEVDWHEVNGQIVPGAGLGVDLP